MVQPGHASIVATSDMTIPRLYYCTGETVNKHLPQGYDAPGGVGCAGAPPLTHLSAAAVLLKGAAVPSGLAPLVTWAEVRALGQTRPLKPSTLQLQIRYIANMLTCSVPQCPTSLP